MCNDQECKGVYVSENYKNVNMLLYADDLVLIGDQIGNVQKLINVLSEFCFKWGLKVNMEKTKLLVYRNGGIVKANEKCYFNGVQIENVSYYKYLGVIISTRLSWTPAQSNLASQALKAMFIIDKINYDCQFSYKTSCELFKKCIVPILTYGCEVWGTRVHYSIENVLLSFCKKQLGVGSSTPTPAVLGECGQFPLFISCYLKTIKYWLKIIEMPENCLVRSCYQMMYNVVNVGRKNWASDVKNILFSYGFGYVWEEQAVNNIQGFLQIFKQRLEDCYIQTWNTNRSNMSKLDLYNLFKHDFVSEQYLYFNIPRRLRKHLAKFRTSNTGLEIEIGRHVGIDKADRLCKLCGQQNLIYVEDEYHVMLECQAYTAIRKLFIGNVEINMHSFINTMSTKTLNKATCLANYICSMFKIRTEKLLYY